MKRAMLVTVLILTAIAFVAFAAEEIGEWRTAITTVFAGLIGVPVTQFLKRMIDRIFPKLLSKRVTMWMAYVSAFLVTVVVMAVTGGLRDALLAPWTLITEGTVAFAIATLAYRTITDRMELSREAE